MASRISHKKILVIENLDSIPMIDETKIDNYWNGFSERGDLHPEDQLSFLTLCRNPEEGDIYRLLGGGYLPPENERENKIYNVLPKEITTFITLRDNSKYQINPQIYKRSYDIIDLREN